MAKRKKLVPPGLPTVEIDPKELPIMRCVCGSFLFVQAVEARLLGKIQSPDGQEHVVMAGAGLACLRCGQIGKLVKQDTAAHLVAPGVGQKAGNA